MTAVRGEIIFGLGFKLGMSDHQKAALYLAEFFVIEDCSVYYTMPCFLLFMVMVFPLAALSKPAELGRCIPQKDSFNGTEETYARREAEKARLSDHEVLARLIFSESLSTGYWRRQCNAPSDKLIMETIGWGIMNRVEKFKQNSDPYYDVVFQKNQFRTSFSTKKNNPFAASFLCPLKAQDYLDRAGTNASALDLYREAKSISKKIVDQFKTHGIPLSFRGITNFFYPKSEFFGELRPSWAKNSIPEKNLGYLDLLKSRAPCVEFYKF
jgi:hypothetical protein